MTGRDRLVIVGIAVLAILAAGWLLLVSPERKQAAQAQTQVESARQKLQSAQSQVASARSAQASYSSAYASVVRLGKAVPPQQEVPSLMYELEQASNQRAIDFTSIMGSSSGSSGSAASATATATPAGFSQMPFTFVFKGSFFGLAHLLSQIDGFARITAANGNGTAGASTAADSSATPASVQVSGRLLTIQGVNLTLESQGSAGSGSSGSSGGTLSATITATAYVLPASQSLTAGATAAGPAGTSAAHAASSAAASSSPTSAAVIQGTP
jgi:Tfp pilus assembly protein PilO